MRKIKKSKPHKPLIHQNVVVKIGQEIAKRQKQKKQRRKRRQQQPQDITLTQQPIIQHPIIYPAQQQQPPQQDIKQLIKEALTQQPDNVIHIPVYEQPVVQQQPQQTIQPEVQERVEPLQEKKSMMSNILTNIDRMAYNLTNIEPLQEKPKQINENIPVKEQPKIIMKEEPKQKNAMYIPIKPEENKPIEIPVAKALITELKGEPFKEQKEQRITKESLYNEIQNLEPSLEKRKEYIKGLNIKKGETRLTLDELKLLLNTIKRQTKK